MLVPRLSPRIVSPLRIVRTSLLTWCRALHCLFPPCQVQVVFLVVSLWVNASWSMLTACWRGVRWVGWRVRHTVLCHPRTHGECKCGRLPEEPRHYCSQITAAVNLLTSVGWCCHDTLHNAQVRWKVCAEKSILSWLPALFFSCQLHSETPKDSNAI